MCVLEYLNYVNEKYPHLVKINEHNKNISKTARSQTAPRFFIIKSFTEEDIHKVNNNIINIIYYNLIITL